MNALLRRVHELMAAGLDISEHLGLLRGLAMDPEVKSIVEIGFRTGVSASALASAGKPLTCYDIEPCAKGVAKLRALAKNFSLIQGDSLAVTIPKCELLHIDSLHTYKQLIAELRSHAKRSSKWIALHDTTTFASKGKDGTMPGLADAISNFLGTDGTEWTLHLNLTNNNGLTLLRRKH